MDKFKLKRHIAIFDFIKTKGLAISSIVSILSILPFLGYASVNSLIKSGIKVLDIKASKDVFYDIKNNELINWRRLLMFHVKRFMYLISHNVTLQKDGKTALIIDDSTLEKTGKKIENVGTVYDHTGNIYILGYKLLVCGFWDGDSFIPIDFSLHREKGSKHFKLINLCKKLAKQIVKQAKQLSKLSKRKIRTHKKRQIEQKQWQIKMKNLYRI